MKEIVIIQALFVPKTLAQGPDGCRQKQCQKREKSFESRSPSWYILLQVFAVSLVSDDGSWEVAIGEYCKKGAEPRNILDILGYFGNILDISEISTALTFII